MKRTVIIWRSFVYNQLQLHLGWAAEMGMAASILQFQHARNAPHLHLPLAAGIPRVSVCGICV